MGELLTREDFATAMKIIAADIDMLAREADTAAPSDTLHELGATLRRVADSFSR